MVADGSSSALPSSDHQGLLGTLSATAWLGMSDDPHGKDACLDVADDHGDQTRAPRKFVASGHSKHASEVGDIQELGGVERFLRDRSLPWGKVCICHRCGGIMCGFCLEAGTQREVCRARSCATVQIVMLVPRHFDSRVFGVRCATAISMHGVIPCVAVPVMKEVGEPFKGVLSPTAAVLIAFLKSALSFRTFWLAVGAIWFVRSRLVVSSVSLGKRE